MKKFILLFLLCALYNCAFSQWILLSNEYVPVQSVISFDSVVIIAVHYQSTDNFSLAVSNDYGDTWHGTNVAPGINVHYLCHTDDMVYACATNGIYKSGKAPLDWLPYHEGLPGGAILKMAVAGDVMLAMNQTSLYKRIAGDTAWTIITEASPVSTISDFDFDGNLIVLAGLDGIAESYDLGETFTVWPGYVFSWDAVMIKGDTIIAASKGGMRRKLLQTGNIANVNSGLPELWSPYGGYYGAFYTFHMAGSRVFVGAESGLYTLHANLWHWIKIGSGAYGLSSNEEMLFAARGYSGVWAASLDQLTFAPETTAPSSSLKIYPIPARNTITVEIASASIKSKTLTVFTLSGQQIYERNVTEPNTVIDVSAWPQGLYLVRIAGANDVEVVRFVKQ
jgi:hypothetical protein